MKGLITSICATLFCFSLGASAEDVRLNPNFPLFYQSVIYNDDLTPETQLIYENIQAQIAHDWEDGKRRVTLKKRFVKIDAYYSDKVFKTSLDIVENAKRAQSVGELQFHFPEAAGGEDSCAVGCSVNIEKITDYPVDVSFNYMNDYFNEDLFIKSIEVYPNMEDELIYRIFLGYEDEYHGPGKTLTFIEQGTFVRTVDGTRRPALEGSDSGEVIWGWRVHHLRDDVYVIFETITPAFERSPKPVLRSSDKNNPDTGAL